jgi:uncharacterized OsmC-like protein
MAAETTPGSPAMRSALPRRALTASNDGGMRTVTRTSDGLRLITDEPASRGGISTAPTPLETVIGALCGCSSATFANAAREQGFRYTGIDFGASFTLDAHGPAG